MQLGRRLGLVEDHDYARSRGYAGERVGIVLHQQVDQFAPAQCRRIRTQIGQLANPLEQVFLPPVASGCFKCVGPEIRGGCPDRLRPS